VSVIIDRKVHIKAIKQQFIVDATINLIAENGIDNIRMDDIATASNYTKRTLYAYFKSKEEIILWLFTDDLTSRWNYQQEQLSLCEMGLDKLNVWGTSLFEYYDKNQHSLQIQNYISYHSVHTDKVSEAIFERFKLINDELADWLRSIFHLGIEDGSFRKDIEIDITISQFLYSLRAVISRAFSDSYSFVEFDKSIYVKHFQNLFARSISG
jgi:AcrR family transcriptional regulator